MNLEAAAQEIAAANQAYLAGDYGTAIARYETALEAGADGADLWFNLGNAFYRAGEEGRAVLAFERVLRRDPGDQGARENLTLIRSQSQSMVAAPSPSLLDRIGARADPDVATALLVVCWSLACATFFWRRVLGAGRARLAATIALALLVAGSAVAGVATFATWEVRNDGAAIVVEAGEVLRAPDPTAPTLFSAPEGLQVRAEARIGGYALVRLGERTGWIEASRIEPIDR